METKFIIDQKFEEKTKNTFYDNYNSVPSAIEVSWRDFGAISKCESILALCSGKKINRVVEVGCGLCNVISRLNELNFASEYYGLEISPSSLNYIRENVRIKTLKAVYLLDTTKTTFEDDFFDLAILSHVIEHVHNPENLIRESLRISKNLIIEVPLEDCLSLNVYSKIVEKVFNKKRESNPIGHINFFNKVAVERLVNESGGKVVNARAYRSWRVYSPTLRPSIMLEYLNSILFYLIFKLSKSGIVDAHYTMLVRKK